MNSHFTSPTTMTADQFRNWMVRMGAYRAKPSLSEREASEALGWARMSVRQRLSGAAEVPVFIVLACRMLEIDAASGRWK